MSLVDVMPFDEDGSFREEMWMRAEEGLADSMGTQMLIDSAVGLPNVGGMAVTIAIQQRGRIEEGGIRHRGILKNIPDDNGLTVS
jgi:hypothetical protein